VVVLLIGLFVLPDYLRITVNVPPPEQGWKTILWDAGYGSWGHGGFGVYYILNIPNDYGFVQKLGAGWINDTIPEDLISVSYYPPSRPERNLEDFTKLHLRWYPDDPVKMLPEKTVMINGTEFRRIDFSANKAPYERAESVATAKGGFKGFWLSDHNIDVLTELRDAQGLETCERIVATIRRR
jgi:hypothetical protein